MGVYSFSWLFGFFVSFFIGVAVFLRNFKSLTNILYFLFSLMLSFFALGNFLRLFSENMILNTFIIIGLLFFPPLLLHSVNYIVVGRKNLPINILIALGYLFAIGFTFLYFGFSVLFLNLFLWTYLIFACLFLIVSIFRIFYYMQKYKSIKKVRLKIFTWAILSLAFSLVVYLLNFYLSMRIPLDGLLFIIYTFITLFAITKFDLLSTSIVIPRYASYVLMFVLFLSTVYVCYLSFFSWVFMTIFGFIWVLFGNNLRELIQTGAQERWVADWYDTDVVIRDVAEKLAVVIKKEDIFKVIIEEIKHIMKLKDAFALVASYDSEGNIEQYKLQNSLFSLVSYLPKNDPLIKLFNKQEDPLIVKNVKKDNFKSLEDLRVALKSLLFPIYSENEKNGKKVKVLEAVLILGPKSSERNFDKKDFMLLMVLSKQIALSLVNSKLYERIKRDNEMLSERVQQKVEEIKKAMEFAEKSNHLASLAQLSLGICHELGTPIAVMKGTSEDMLEEIKDPDAMKNYISMMVRKTKELDEIVRSMVKFGKVEVGEMQKIDINAFMKDLISFVENSFAKEKIIVKGEFKRVGKIMADPVKLNQVFMNLLSNAKDAIEKNGEIIIETNIETRQDKPWVVVNVKDTGKGINDIEDMKSKLFDPHFTDKGPGHLGLGLSIVHSVIKKHGGFIDVESIPGNTVFKVYFPKV